MTVYISMARMGYCLECNQWKDLRHGYCFQCCIEAELEKKIITLEIYESLMDRFVRK